MDIDEDSTLYTAMIWALGIGIIIVVVTLFLTRPAPENFTELYFNNHATLPEYGITNSTYNYSFTIHNLENKPMNYTYGITTYLYKIDYTCEKPDLYMEQSNISHDQTIVNKYDQITRSTDTNDVNLLIKDPIYATQFDYSIKTGSQIVVSFIGVDSKEKYSIIMNHDTNNVYFVNNNQAIKANVQVNMTSRVNMRVTNETITFIVGGQTLHFKTPKEYTGGFIRLETTYTYAEITNMIIDRPDSRELVYVRLADQQYTEQVLQKNSTPDTVIVYSRYLAINDPLLSKLLYDPTLNTQHVVVSSTYYGTTPVSMPGYTAKLSATINSGSLTMDVAGLDITFNKDARQIIIQCTNCKPTKIDVLSSMTSISATFTNNNAKIYYNGNLLTTLDNITLQQTIPYIKINGDMTLQSFSINANSKPATINYIIPESQQTTSYTAIYNSKTFTDIKGTNESFANANLSIEQKNTVQNFFDSQKITWEDYRTVVSYQRPVNNATLTLAFSNLDTKLYSLSLDNSGLMKFQYLKSKNTLTATRNVTLGGSNTIQMDNINNTITININSKYVFSAKVDSATDALFTIDYGNITITNAQVQDLDTKSVRIYQRQTSVECQPILISEDTTTGNAYLLDTASRIFWKNVKITEPFDLAKIQITLNNSQEIHFWLKALD